MIPSTSVDGASSVLEASGMRYRIRGPRNVGIRNLIHPYSFNPKLIEQVGRIWVSVQELHPEVMIEEQSAAPVDDLSGARSPGGGTCYVESEP